VEKHFVELARGKMSKFISFTKNVTGVDLIQSQFTEIRRGA
jgi:hypothetical protein